MRAALAEGFAVRVLVRKTSPRQNLAGLPIETIEGDMREEATLARALAGARFLFHAAADYRLWAPDPSEIERNNLLGTEAVMRAALRARLERVVYTSSVATLRVTPETCAADETAVLSPTEAIGAYKRSKVLAERCVEDLIANEGLAAVIVNPSTPIGPRDIRPTPTGRIIVQAARGNMPAFVDTGLNLVNVDDVARGHLQALRCGRIGERYILGGENVMLETLLADICGLAGQPKPRLELPRWPLIPLAWAAESVARLTRREPFLTRDGLKMAANHMFFTSAKAQQELKYAPGPYRPALVAALQWFGQSGYLDSRHRAPIH